MRKLFLTALLGAFTVICFGQFAGGSGSQFDPWQIGTAEHLNSVRDYLGIDHSDKHYVQIADIDLGTAPWNQGEGWVPLGSTAELSFQGNYDGGGYTISNMTINRVAHNQALFGYTVSAAIKNIGLRNINIVATGRDRIAGLVAWQDGQTSIERCYVSGAITASNEVAGLVGRMNNAAASILDCYGAVTITRLPPGGFDIVNPIVGGFVGLMINGQIRRCYSFSSISTSATTRGGAVVGSRTGGEISQIYWNMDTANRPFAVGSEDAYPGSTTLQMLRRDLYQGFDFNNVWGIAEEISYPYLRWQEGPDQINILGPRNLTGRASNRTMDLTWQAPILEIEPLGYNVYRNGQRINGDLVEELQYRDTGLTNWQLYDYYVTAVFEVGESSLSNLFRGAPVGFAGGTGTEDDPYLVETAEHLNNVRLVLTSHFRQIADIDLDVEPYNQGTGWNPIGDGINQFRGHYDGDFYRIFNLRITKVVTQRNLFHQALFGYINESTLKKIIIDNSSVTAGMYTALLAGTANASRIHQCSASGYVLGLSRVGALVGQGLNQNQVSESYATGSINGHAAASIVGGIIGYQASNSFVINCYSTASVSGNQEQLGGIVGTNWETGSVHRSYAIGLVQAHFPLTNIGGLVGLHRPGAGTVAESYWNIDSTQQAESQGGGVGLGTTDMVTAESYENWDFENIWAINEGVTYPYLQWQGAADFHNIPPPFNFTVTPDYEEEEINLSWQNLGNPVRYDIYKDNELAASVNHPTTVWTDTDCEVYVEYSYYVRAIYIIDEEEIASPPTFTAIGVLLVPFAGGDGSIENPYQVAIPAHINNIRYLLDKHYLQVADINLGVAPWNEEEGWVPIGSLEPGRRFSGSYDGAGLIISNLFINRPTAGYQSLFAYAFEAVLSNINVQNVDITAREYAAGLLSYQNDCHIINSSTGGTIVISNAYGGGLVAYMNNAAGNLIQNCSAATNVSGMYYIGGLVGDAHAGQIMSCSASGNVSSSNMYVGGLVGFNRVPIRESFATGNATGQSFYTGGLVGVTETNGVIRNSYARGNVQGPNHAGGFAGRNSLSTIANCYSTGRVTGGVANVGGFVGSNTGEVESCYWDRESSETEISVAGEHRATRQMTYPYDDLTYIEWDFEESWANDTAGNINDGYPILYYQAPPILESPEVNIEMVNIEGIDYLRVSWGLVDNARSYRIYDSASVGNWGDPIAILGVEATEYLEEVTAAPTRFFYVTASTEEAPGE